MMVAPAVTGVAISIWLGPLTGSKFGNGPRKSNYDLSVFMLNISGDYSFGSRSMV